jgi:DegV family protein with EDD domain
MARQGLTGNLDPIMAVSAVAVVADSAAALAPDLAAHWGITVVPMQLEVAGRPLSEADMPLDELVRHLDDGVQTSAPPPGAFVEAVRSALEAGSRSAVVLTVGSNLSSTYQSALTASRLVGDDGGVRVVDTGTAAGAEGLVVLAAAQEAAAGGSLAEVEARAQLAAGEVRLVAAVEELKYLVRGGRLASGAARAGEHLGVRPVFELRRGKIRPLRPSLSADGALDQILAQWRRSVVEGADLHVAALHALRDEDAVVLLDKVRAEVEPVTALIGTFGPVMVAHTGPGVIGLAWWWERRPEPAPSPPGHS